jgi:CRP/FNR family transcriptional regulator, dissimilatory nitrate respiration regulator
MKTARSLNEQVIRHSPLFRELDDASWQRVSALIRLVEKKRGETIFSEGEPAHGFYMVESGTVKVFKLSPEGREQIIRIFSPGEHFGEAAVFSGGTFPASGASLTDCVLAYFPAGDFYSLVRENPDIGLNMLGAMSRYLHHLVKVIEELSLKEVPARLAKFLLEHALPPGELPNGAPQYLLPVNKGELALYLGTTAETLSRVLSRMKRRGIISEKKKTIVIHNVEALREMLMGGEA